MVQELSYSTISLVLDSWEALRRIENYEEVAGSLLFQRLFEKCPQAKVLFGFQLDTDPRSPELLKSKRFLMHASYLIQMLDAAINMLGPDVELLTEIMLELGAKHKGYGVKPEMFATMGIVLMSTLTDTLSPEVFCEATRQAWKETFSALTHDMVRAMKALESQ